MIYFQQHNLRSEAIMALETSAGENPSLLESLKQSAGQPKRTPFRERAKFVGSVYTISYTNAIVAVYDHDREQAGGLPKNGFLMGAKIEEDESFILLRIQKEARLPAAAANDQTRQESIEETGNQGPWADRLPHWTRDKMSLHGLECSVLGTFLTRHDGTYLYAEDIANYYAVNELMVWKPDAESLDLIVNHQHRANDIPITRKAAKIGRTRFAAADPDDVTKAEFRINPADIMNRRTAYFGMSRSGKSNGLKIVAENVYRIREDNPEHRVGQVIFDLSGEYAQDTYQDGKGLHRVHETIGLPREPEVATYGLLPPPDWDKERKVMKLNFFGNPFPARWTTETVENALEQLMAGRMIINSIMEGEGDRYTTAFRDADISVPQNATGNHGAQVRYQRAILAYQTALAAAGLTPPRTPSLKIIGGDGSLLGQNITKHLELDQNQNSDNKTEYHQAAEILKRANSPQGKITWEQLQTVFTALDKFVRDNKSGYQVFENAYISRPKGSGEPWADQKLKAVISIFRTPNGPRTFQITHEQHDPNAANDFAKAVVEDLQKGKLVIIDQSAGEPEQNQAAAERVMWRIFRSQQDKFRSALARHDPSKPPDESQATEGHIIVYIEEAHNLLPNANARNTLQTVWAKAAKEGSKYNIGMVLATQAPSTVMREILTETDNWVLSYLNSGTERRFVADYMDFDDFIDQIGKVSERGFVRIRTLSQAYTVPVQLDKFVIEDASATSTTDRGTLTEENHHRTNQHPLL